MKDAMNDKFGLTDQKIREAEHQLAVMKAFKDGKVIEHRFAGGDEWFVVQFPVWSWGDTDYRVAIPVVERWLVMDGDRCVHLALTKGAAEDSKKSYELANPRHSGYRVVHVVEKQE